jgi:uncharacterized protein
LILRRALLALACALLGAPAHALPRAAGPIERATLAPVVPRAVPPAQPEQDLPSRPQLAIVIDDLGHDAAAGRRVIALPDAVACAVLPGTPHGRALAAQARARGHEVLLHLPMQADTGTPLPPYGLHAGMPPAALAAALGRALETVPGAVGVNNHQGSMLTAQAAPMAALMGLLAGRGLYFIDSRTTASTVAAREAQRAGVPTLERAVFLDHDPGPPAVRAQWQAAIARARRDGQALAIGHPRRATLAVLETELARLPVDVALVAPSALLSRHAGAGTAARAPSGPLPMDVTPP